MIDTHWLSFWKQSCFSHPHLTVLPAHLYHILSCLCFPGHLMSTAEVEAALTGHPAVAEAAVVSRPHKVKGECLYCFVTLKNSHEFNHTLVDEIKRHGEWQSEGAKHQPHLQVCGKQYSWGPYREETKHRCQWCRVNNLLKILICFARKKEESQSLNLSKEYLCIFLYLYSSRKNWTNRHSWLHSKCSCTPKNPLR